MESTSNLPSTSPSTKASTTKVCNVNNKSRSSPKTFAFFSASIICRVFDKQYPHFFTLGFTNEEERDQADRKLRHSGRRQWGGTIHSSFLIFILFGPSSSPCDLCKFWPSKLMGLLGSARPRFIIMITNGRQLVGRYIKCNTTHTVCRYDMRKKWR